MTQQRVSPVVITSVLPATTTLSVQGAVGQSANLFEVKNSSGTIVSNITAAGVQQITTASASTKGLIVKGSASQTGTLLEFQSSTGQVLGGFSSSGYPSAASSFFSAGFIRASYFSVGDTIINSGDNASFIRFNPPATLSGAVQIASRNATHIPLVTQGFTSQTADLTQWQNSAGTVLGKVTSDGTIENSSDINCGVSLRVGSGASAGGGYPVLAIKNATVVPSSNPSGGGVLYTEAGALKYRGSSGTITTIANA